MGKQCFDAVGWAWQEVHPACKQLSGAHYPTGKHKTFGVTVTAKLTHAKIKYTES